MELTQSEESRREDTAAAERIRKKVESWAAELVDDQEALFVELVCGKTFTIEVDCAEDDAPKLVGRGGRVIHSLQHLAEAAAGKFGLVLEVRLLK